MTDTNVPGEIPQSSALSEASIDSLAEAISRFDSSIQRGTTGSPEARKDLRTIIRRLVEQRERWEAAEASAPQHRTSATKVPLGRKIGASLKDLDL